MVQITDALLDSIEALNRLDVPIADVQTVSQLRQAVLDNFGLDSLSSTNIDRASLNKLMRTAQFVQKQLAPNGIRAIPVTLQSGKVITRFSIQGSRGLFGAEAVNEYLASLIS